MLKLVVHKVSHRLKKRLKYVALEQQFKQLVTLIFVLRNELSPVKLLSGP